MSKRTGVIRYNLNDTGRTFTGQPRRIDIGAAMRLFNGPAMQEAVRKGDIVGYIGHQYREKYTLAVPETVIEDGKEVVLVPVTRTVHIKCYPNGDIEHEQEFLDTPPGRVGQRLWESKVYGFSSAIYAPEENGVRVPKGYFGMDLVRGPNYDTNRGYMLDSTGAGAFMLADTFASDMAAMLDSVDSLIKTSDEQAMGISTAYLEQCKVNDDLVETIAIYKERLQALGASAMLDSAPTVMERGIPMDKGTALLDSASRFMANADLPGYVDTEQDKAEEQDAKSMATTVKTALAVVGSVMRGY